jgi:hypothetical protein
MPNVENAFANFAKATIFSVLDLNSAYYQIPLSAKSRKATAFCTPFGLFEFTKLPMGNSVGCQVLSRVVDTLFGDLKHQFCVQLYGRLARLFSFHAGAPGTPQGGFH